MTCAPACAANEPVRCVDGRCAANFAACGAVGGERIAESAPAPKAAATSDETDRPWLRAALTLGFGHADYSARTGTRRVSRKNTNAAFGVALGLGRSSLFDIDGYYGFVGPDGGVGSSTVVTLSGDLLGFLQLQNFSVGGFSNDTDWQALLGVSPFSFGRRGGTFFLGPAVGVALFGSGQAAPGRPVYESDSAVGAFAGVHLDFAVGRLANRARFSVAYLPSRPLAANSLAVTFVDDLEWTFLDLGLAWFGPSFHFHAEDLLSGSRLLLLGGVTLRF